MRRMIWLKITLLEINWNTKLKIQSEYTTIENLREWEIMHGSVDSSLKFAMPSTKSVLVLFIDRSEFCMDDVVSHF